MGKEVIWERRGRNRRDTAVYRPSEQTGMDMDGHDGNSGAPPGEAIVDGPGELTASEQKSHRALGDRVQKGQVGGGC